MHKESPSLGYIEFSSVMLKPNIYCLDRLLSVDTETFLFICYMLAI